MFILYAADIPYVIGIHNINKAMMMIRERGMKQ